MTTALILYVIGAVVYAQMKYAAKSRKEINMFLNTKKEYQEKLFDIINPLLPHYSEGRARLKLGFTGANYSPATAEMEGFARVIWGLAPYLHGGGKSRTFQEYYLQGLTHGTNPQDSEYWGDIEAYDQRSVEIAAIAVGLLLAPNDLWEPLTSEAKDNLAKWIASINAHPLMNNNWQFFGVLANVALKKLGRSEFSQEALDVNLARINSYYEGNGWYRDGEDGDHDYYIAFAIHFYGLIYSSFMAEDDPVNSKNFKERAMLFGPQFVYWFDETGVGIPYGRSLTYRFAQVAFFSACVFAGIEPVDMAVMKGIIDRNLNLWWKSHMRDFSGILTIGYAYPNLVMSENYNSPGSPLWSLKAFLLLALDDNHPYWSISAADFPELPDRYSIPEAKMIITHQRTTGAVLYPEGLHYWPNPIGHEAEKYSKFAYSSKYGFSVHKGSYSLEDMAPDSELIFQVGDLFFGRRSVDSSTIKDNIIKSRWSPYHGIDVESSLTPYRNGYYIEHLITSSVECTAYICGFAISKDEPGFDAIVTRDAAMVKSDISHCELRSFGNIGKIINAAPNTNLIFPRTAIPAMKRRIGVGKTKFECTVLTLRRDGRDDVGELEVE